MGAELHHFAKCENDEACTFSGPAHSGSDRGSPVPKITATGGINRTSLAQDHRQRLLPLHRFLRNYIKKRQKRGAFPKCDPELAAHVIVSIPSYYGLAKILFAWKPHHFRRSMATGFARIILDGLHAVDGSSGKSRRIRHSGRKASTGVLESAGELE